MPLPDEPIAGGLETSGIEVRNPAKLSEAWKADGEARWAGSRHRRPATTRSPVRCFVK